MKLHFLGTGAAEGVPAVFCQCEVCQEARKRGDSEYHTLFQLVIDDVLGVDFPPDAYYHALRFGVDLRGLQHLLITHSHMDHFYAHDFVLRGYKYCSPIDNPLTIYGNSEVKKVFEECTRREMREEVSNKIRMVEVQPFQPFICGAYKATALLAQHAKTETAFVYLIEQGTKSYLHLTDTGLLPQSTLNYLEAWSRTENRCVSFVTFDCTFLFNKSSESGRHMDLEDNKAMQAELLKRGVVNADTKYAVTHYSHNNNPLSETLKRVERSTVFSLLTM